MAVVGLLLVALTFELSVVATEVAARCRPCTLGTPQCAPKGGILLFNSVPPNVPAYWSLFANRRRPVGRLVGRLKVRSDVVDPGVPGFPGELRDDVYFGESGRFRGTARDDQIEAVASYPDGSSCDFAVTIAFGLGGANPNTFVCRDPAGNVVAQGGVDVQGIRLRGCRRPSGQ
jgi:hypothetical protein